MFSFKIQREKKDKTKEALKNLIDSLARSFDGKEE